MSRYLKYNEHFLPRKFNELTCTESRRGPHDLRVSSSPSTISTSALYPVPLRILLPCLSVISKPSTDKLLHTHCSCSPCKTQPLDVLETAQTIRTHLKKAAANQSQKFKDSTRDARHRGTVGARNRAAQHARRAEGFGDQFKVPEEGPHSSKIRTQHICARKRYLCVFQVFLSMRPSSIHCLCSCFRTATSLTICTIATVGQFLDIAYVFCYGFCRCLYFG